MITEKTEKPMNRAEFLRSLGLSSAALMAIYCLGSVTTACTSKREDVEPSTTTGTTTGTGTQKLDFTLDLTASANSALNTNGGYVYPTSTALIVARTTSGDFVALSKACTHQGSTVSFQSDNNRFHCATHGSNFATDGSVINGPATSALKQYSTSLSGNSLRVYES